MSLRKIIPRKINTISRAKTPPSNIEFIDFEILPANSDAYIKIEVEQEKIQEIESFKLTTQEIQEIEPKPKKTKLNKKAK